MSSRARALLGTMGGAAAALAAAIALFFLRTSFDRIASKIAAYVGPLETFAYSLLLLAYVGTIVFLLALTFTHLFRLPTVGGWIRKITIYTLLSLLALFLAAPFIWMVMVSLHKQKSPIPDMLPIAGQGPLSGLPNLVPKREVLVHPDTGQEVSIPPGAEQVALVREGREVTVAAESLPRVARPDWHPENYRFVLFHERLPVSRFFLNTVFVAVAVVVGQLFISSLAAYGFARLKFRGSGFVFALFLGSMMFAGTVTTIPVFLMIQKVGWLNTYWALIVPGISSAFTVFLLRQFFLQVPAELDEAARIDGAGEFRIYWSVILPLSRAALATAAAFTFFGVWTDFFGPLIYTNTVEMRTLEVGLSVFKNSYGGNNWPIQMAAAVIVMAPLVLVFLLTQRYFTKGIMLGSIK